MHDKVQLAMFDSIGALHVYKKGFTRVLPLALALLCVDIKSNYVPPTEGGGHIVFGAVPVGVGVGVGVRVGVRVRVASFLRDIF